LLASSDKNRTQYLARAFAQHTTEKRFTYSGAQNTKFQPFEEDKRLLRKLVYAAVMDGTIYQDIDITLKNLTHHKLNLGDIMSESNRGISNLYLNYTAIYTLRACNKLDKDSIKSTYIDDPNKLYNFFNRENYYQIINYFEAGGDFPTVYKALG